uniref:Uncharacterized protein n=1 Tax=Oryza nivara TaxID=4536 RepID=A0A0E0HRN9_ORYNI
MKGPLTSQIHLDRWSSPAAISDPPRQMVVPVGVAVCSAREVEQYGETQRVWRVIDSQGIAGNKAASFNITSRDPARCRGRHKKQLHNID